MTLPSNLLENAIALYKSGKKLDARQLLTTIIQADPKNEIAWSWYIETFPEPEKRIELIEQFLKINPESQKAQKGLIRLLKGKLERGKLEPENTPKTFLKAKWKIVAIMMVGIGILFAVFLVIFGTTYEINYALSKQINNLQTNYDQLLERYIEKQTAYNKLQVEYANLQTEHAALQSDYDTLNQDYDNLSGQFNEFQKIAIIPPYIITKNRNVTIAFNKLDGTVDYWEIPFDSLENESYRGYFTRSIAEESSNIVSLKTDNGEYFYVEDMTLFVDPSSFENVIPKLYRQSGSDSSFIKEVWNIVTQLSIYSQEIGEIPRFPSKLFSRAAEIVRILLYCLPV
ncbi:MAG: DUF2730 domain-containing protein [Anaerolineales bacterium]|nr:DUF2730 domain-containing protein [Anaerolineales bacterium]